MFTPSINTCGFLLVTEVTEGSEMDPQNIVLVVRRL